MALLELHRVRKPAECVAKRAERELNQHLAVRGQIIVDKNALAILPRLDAEAHIVTLAAVHASGF